MIQAGLEATHAGSFKKSLKVYINVTCYPRWGRGRMYTGFTWEGSIILQGEWSEKND